MQKVNIYVETPRLLLREIRSGDLLGVLQSNNIHILPWLHKNSYPLPARSFAKWVDECINQSKMDISQRDGYNAGVILKEGDEFIGEIGLDFKDFKLQIGDIGFWIAREYQGRGYMTEAVSYFRDFLFGHLTLSQLEASTYFNNIPSEKVLEKTGFSFVRKGRTANFWKLGREDYLKHREQMIS